MKPTRSRWFLMALYLLLAGCGLNSVRPLPPGGPILSNSAVIVYGVGIEGHWDAPQYSVILDEYDFERQSASGNCFRFNRAEAVIPGTPGPVHYFAFEVPAGHYIYSAFHVGSRFDGRERAFAAPAGRSVYIGDFVYGKDKHLTLRRDLAAFQRKREAVLPQLNGEISLAQAMPAKPSGLFLCTP